jgi:dTMP kinase
VDRYAGFKQDWGGYYEAGGLLVADRYTTSNAIHQACKLPALERTEFFRWLADFEYQRLGLPRPDLVLWMDIPIARTVENLRRREADTHTAGDIHEVDTAYLRSCYEAAGQAAAFYGWRRVDCVDEDGRMRPAQDIHREVMALLNEL